MAEEISKEMDVGVPTLRDALEEAFTDIYGPDGFTTYKFKGLPEFKAKGMADTISIVQEDSNAYLDTSEAQPETAEKVEQILLEKQGGAGHAGKTPDNEESVGDVEASADGINGGQTGSEGVSVFNDGSIRFTPEYTKQEAKYMSPTGNETDKECRNCAHYIEGGGCHVVQGDIDPGGTCWNFYSDVGIFAKADGKDAAVNLVLYGEQFDLLWDHDNFRSLIERVKQRVGDRAKK